MKESDAIDLLLKTSCLDQAEQPILAARKIVAELGYIPCDIFTFVCCRPYSTSTILPTPRRRPLQIS